ncbi:unnamed protein product [Clonostachys rhizophaga]|uniref:C2H2-type domain-containing protein n=1 Tax=Clonostachys rhizophaga TaxID=160324 RepID=A0A9N9VV19_9HYPO|nr:unnamed protein product [Clonostachys rhizophaga]
MASTCQDRILSAPAHHVKATLAFLCKDSEVEKLTLARLDALARMEKAATEAPGNKRKATEELAVCVQCEAPFYKDENHIGACSYHPGEMEVDDDNDFWADHDENIHGTIDSDWARKEYPGGFIWSCCEKNAEGAPGCTTGRHEADPQKAWKDGSEEEEA